MVAHALLICLHVMAAAFWVGGMAVMHAVVRPAAAAALPDAPTRLKLMAAALERFFAAVAVAIAVLLATGSALIVQAGGFGALHASVHVMVLAGLAMTGVYAWLRLGPYVRLRAAVARDEWRPAGAALAQLRAGVVVNLSVGVAVAAIAFVGRVLW